MVVGILAATALAAALLPAASSAQSGKARHDLVFRAAGASRQNVIGAHGIVISVRCPVEACTVVASAAAGSPSVRTAKVRAHVAAGGRERLTLPLGARARAGLASALKAGKAPTLTVHVTAHDAYGSKVPLTLTVKPVKP